MDPWKIATAGLATLSVSLIAALGVVWSQGPAESPTTLGGEVANEVAVERPLERPSTTVARSARTQRQVPLTPSPSLSTSGDSSTWIADASQPLPEDIMERAREQLREERRERGQARRDEIHDDVDTFLEEEGIDAATSDKIHAAMDTMGDQMRSIRDSVRNGELERGEARQAFRQGRDEMVGTFEDLLGEEVAGRLMERLPGPTGAPRSSAGGQGFRRGGGL